LERPYAQLLDVDEFTLSEHLDRRSASVVSQTVELMKDISIGRFGLRFCCLDGDYLRRLGLPDVKGTDEVD